MKRKTKKVGIVALVCIILTTIFFILHDHYNDKDGTGPKSTETKIFSGLYQGFGIMSIIFLSMGLSLYIKDN
jgi:hypothetical protein